MKSINFFNGLFMRSGILFKRLFIDTGTGRRVHKKRGASCDTPPSVLETEPPHAVSCRFSTRQRLQNVNRYGSQT